MGKKRGNGEGSFRKRSMNSWEGRVMIEGEVMTVRGKTKAETREKLTAVQSEILNGEYVDENDLTITEWMNTWIECYTAKAKESTRSRYQQDIRVHIIPDLGSHRIQDLKLLNIQRFLNRCKNVKGLSEKSLKNIYLVLNKALATAQKEGLIKKNPCSDAEIPVYEEPKKRMRPLKDEEIPAFLRMIEGNPYEGLFYMAVLPVCVRAN